MFADVTSKYTSIILILVHTVFWTSRPQTSSEPINAPINSWGVRHGSVYGSRPHSLSAPCDSLASETKNAIPGTLGLSSITGSVRARKQAVELAVREIAVQHHIKIPAYK